MGKPQILRLHDVGACTPLGFCAASSAAAAWAGISRVAAPNVPVKGAHAAVYQAVCPLVDGNTVLAERLVTLASAALTPMLNALEDWPGGLTVFVALPMQSRATTLTTHVIQSLQNSFRRHRRGPQQSLSVKPIMVHPGDFAQSLTSAARYLSAPAAPELCIIGGVDSHVSACQLQALGAQDALYDANTGEGAIPGEAAAFLTVSLPHSRIVQPVLAQLGPWQYSLAKDAGSEDLAPSALALQHSVEQLLPEGASPALWVTDANGESWRASAQALLASAPHMGCLTETEMLEPARLMGDVGVAFAPLACVMALHGISHGLVSTTQALLSAQDRVHATAWQLTARPIHTTALTCGGLWHETPRRVF